MARTIDVPSAIEGILYDMSMKQEQGFSPEAVLAFSMRRFASLARQMRRIDEENKKVYRRKDILQDILEDVDGRV